MKIKRTTWILCTILAIFFTACGTVEVRVQNPTRIDSTPPPATTRVTAAETATATVKGDAVENGDLAIGGIPELIQTLEDEDPAARYHAAVALRDIGPEAAEAVPALIQALEDMDSGVRTAVEALGKIGSEKAVPALTRALEDVEAGVRYVAAVALGEVGQ